MTKPLIPDNIDLRGFEYMPLDVVRLRDSDFTALTSAEAFRAGILLWCAAWHQVPAGSLPSKDLVLSNLAGFGRVVKEWEKVKDEALHGWVLCDDGRYYHPVICEKALESWVSKQEYSYKKFADRLRKKNVNLKKDGLKELDIPEFNQWISCGMPTDWPIDSKESKPSSTGKKNNSAGIPSENSLKGTEQNLREHNINNNSISSSLLGSAESEKIFTDLGFTELPENYKQLALSKYPDLNKKTLQGIWTRFSKYYSERPQVIRMPDDWLNDLWVDSLNRYAQSEIAKQPAKQNHEDHSSRQTESPRTKERDFDDYLDGQIYSGTFTAGTIRKAMQAGESPDYCVARLVREKFEQEASQLKQEYEAREAAKREEQQRKQQVIDEFEAKQAKAGES